MSSPTDRHDETAPAEPEAASGCAHILVADDEPDLAALIKQKFRRRIRKGELDFLFAADGEEALEHLREHPDIDLVLTDINMPRMDGLTLLAELTRLKREDDVLGAVVVTAYGDMMNIRTAMNQGAFDFLTKPIDLDDLEVTIDKALDRVRDEKQAAHARETVGRYLSDEIAETLLAGPEATQLGGERRRVSIMMADLRGFSTMAERLAPEQVLDVLNIHLGAMADVIGTYGGTIDEYLGDGLLVLFGAPVEREDHARRAVACAVAMQQAMTDVNEQVRAMGHRPLQMGIGINTGDVVVGNIGSEKRMKYGVVGSPVNVAGRIESATVGGQVLVSAATKAEAGADVRIRRTMELAAKGFSAPIPLFDVAGVGGHVDLQLPTETRALQPLPRPLPVRFHILDGKQLGDEAVDADLTALSPAAGRLRTDYPLDPFTDLKLHVPIRDATDEPVGNAYAKVLERGDDGWTIHFTSVPEAVALSLRGYLDEAAGRVG
ncbi:MAG: adenylate/guanylate cyclase domain-containing protein [Bacteroidota bacterium]